MRDCPKFLIAVALWAVLARGALATGTEPDKDLKLDPAPCLAAAAANDDDKIIAACGPLIDNEKTEKADRLKARLARGAAYDRKDMLDSAIADYDAALMLDATLADAFNARGELWRRRGDRPKALADFGTAIKLNPDHPSAKGNYKSLAQELERVGALMAVYGKPSFNCATAKKAVEKAICASPELANLDREINATNAKVVDAATRDSPRAGRTLQREQERIFDPAQCRPARSGKALKDRLYHLLAIELN